MLCCVLGDLDRCNLNDYATPVNVTLAWDLSTLRALQSTGAAPALHRALKKAGGDALRKLRTEGTRYVRGRKRVKVSAIRKALRLTFPKSSHLDDMAWTLDVRGVPTPLVAYPNRATRRGVSVAVNQGRRKILSGAFKATMKSGHTGIFRRRGKARLAIDELYSSTVADVFTDRSMIPGIVAQAQTTFAGSLARLLPLELAKLSTMK